MTETRLYNPVKAFFEGLGFDVKGEIAGCDLVATRCDAPEHLIVCELKLSFNLELVLQAVERAALADEVWLAAPQPKTSRGRGLDPRLRQLCRRLGFGALAVSEEGQVSVLVSPDAPLPRRNTKRRSRVMVEYNRRVGDPTPGGSSRVPVMTAYRQGALTCAAAMAEGPKRPRDIRPLVPTAASMLRRNVYGWFLRVDHGLYDLTEAGRSALTRWPAQGAEVTPVDVSTRQPA